MEKFFKIVLVSLGICAFSVSAIADEKGSFSLGVKLGQMDVDVDGADGNSATGLNLGYALSENWALELEIIQGGFEVTGFGDFDIDTMAIYGTYRSSGDGYFLGKVGYLNEDIEGTSDSGASFGIGGGYRFTDAFAVEAEYTIIESDVNLLAITGRFTF